jgi:undecaprenyl-phosphate 4-deoxy-4-formamido-L-arabinose transferase
MNWPIRNQTRPYHLEAADKLTDLSVVIPVYNSEHTLDELVERLGRALAALSPDFEVILVNDGSRDRSWEAICRLSETHIWLHGINLMRNYGQHNALLCGIRAAQRPVIVTMDDDLQHPPEEIHKLLEKLSEGYDVVYGVPHELPHSWWRNAFSVFTKRTLAYVMGVRTIRDLSAFRAFRAPLRRAFNGFQNPNVIIDVLLSWGASRFATVRVNEAPRPVGGSNYNFYKLFQIAMVILTAYSTAPLRFTSMLGFLFTFFGIGVFLYVLGVYFLLGSIPGFPFLASIISLFSGTQLFALGIIGEYLARIFDRSIDRPAYVVEEIAETPSGEADHSPEVSVERTAASQERAIP